MAENQYYDFEKALKKLSLEEEDLKRLISAGEIRAFRDGSQIRLRAADVERVAKDLGVGAGKDADSGEVLEVEEVLFSESAKDADAGMVTTQLSEEDTLLDDGLEVVDIDEAKPAAAAPAAVRGASRAVAAVEKDSKVVMALSAVTLVLMVYGLAFLFAGGESRSNAVTDPVVNLMAGKN